ncbi:unnamed protein product [Brachionus calyciflorus]|uniref:Calponin-homology (CH) domain-containing protein n=1 Tax=Brachionus calyciflorus TaxID=104777 RepID=A0A813NEL0_9BILA|nr:unnamed protein product [Brachionus calyciflorus]
MELNDQILEDLYEWIDQIPLSRQKKRIERDFADGYCVGEIVKHFLPQLIDLHSLTPAHNLQQKLANWGLLNHKIFSKFGLNVPLNITQNICNAKPGYIEVFLYNLRYKIDEKLNELEIKREHQQKAKNSPRNNNSSLNKIKVPTQLRIEYEEKVQECLQQAEEIEILQAKVRRLEHLLELKESRINELTDKLDKYRPTGVSAESSRLKNNNKNSVIVS